MKLLVILFLIINNISHLIVSNDVVLKSTLFYLYLLSKKVQNICFVQSNVYLFHLLFFYFFFAAKNKTLSVIGSVIFRRI